jgi:prepilin-type processing-associated H-X9-DG protein
MSAPIALDVVFEGDRSRHSDRHINILFVDQMQQENGIVLIGLDAFQKLLGFIAKR